MFLTRWFCARLSTPDPMMNKPPQKPVKPRCPNLHASLLTTGIETPQRCLSFAHRSPHHPMHLRHCNHYIFTLSKRELAEPGGENYTDSVRVVAYEEKAPNSSPSDIGNCQSLLVSCCPSFHDLGLECVKTRQPCQCFRFGVWKARRSGCKRWLRSYWGC